MVVNVFHPVDTLAGWGESGCGVGGSLFPINHIYLSVTDASPPSKMPNATPQSSLVSASADEWRQGLC